MTSPSTTPSELRATLDPERLPVKSRITITGIQELAGGDRPLDSHRPLNEIFEETRRRLGFDLQAVAADLRIRPQHLEALERADFDALPGRTYAIGFVRCYAEFLGLSPDECVRRYKQEAHQERPEERELHFPDVVEKKGLPSGTSYVFLAILLILAIYGGWHLSVAGGLTGASSGSLTATAEETAAAGDAVREAQGGQRGGERAMPIVAQNPGGPAAASALPVMNAAAPATAVRAISAPDPAILPSGGPFLQVQPTERAFGAPAEASRLTLKVHSPTWVQIRDADGRVVFENDLRRGDRYRAFDGQDLRLSTWNAGAVELLIDGVSAGRAGARGQQVQQLTLNADIVAARLPEPETAAQ